MKELVYNDFVKIDLKLSFAYYDQDLAFIADIKGKNYLFSLIDDYTYFIVLVDTKVAKRLNELKNLTALFKELDQANKINVLLLDPDAKLAKIEPLAMHNDLRKYLPKTNQRITFDYCNEVEIKPDTDLVKLLNQSK